MSSLVAVSVWIPNLHDLFLIIYYDLEQTYLVI